MLVLAANKVVVLFREQKAVEIALRIPREIDAVGEVLPKEVRRRRGTQLQRFLAWSRITSMNTSNQPLQLCTGAGWESVPLPEDMIPKRAIVTANCLLAVENAGGVSIVAHNADPVNWNTWFPPYVHHDWSLPAGIVTRGDAVRQIQEYMSADEKRKSMAMWRDLKARVATILPGSEIALEDDPFLPVDYWLKYSRSSEVWTVYGFVWYAAKRAHVCGGMSGLQRENVAVIPIGERQWQGRPVVENLVAMMSDAGVAGRLRKAALPL